MSKKRSAIPFIFIALVGGFMIADFVFIGLAKSSFNGVASQNAYQKGVNFNERNKLRLQQDKTGWSGQISYSKQDKLLHFSLKDRANKPLSGAYVQAKVLRPITDKHDQIVTLAPSRNGLYSTELELPLQGQWEIKIKAELKEQEFYMAQRILVN